MRANHSCIRCVLLLGMATGLSACNRETAVAPPNPVEVVVSKPVSEYIEDWDTYTGTVDAKESVDIRSRVRGQIMEVLFVDGEEVEAKKLLVVIDDSPFQADLKQAQGQLETWKAKLKAAEEKIAIYKPLADKGTVAKEELVQAYGAKGEALGGIETSKGKIMEANTNIKYCNIHAPIAGKIGQALLTQGNIVNPGSKESMLTTIVSVDPLYVNFYINERALLNYRKLLRQQYEREKKKGSPDLPVEMALATETGFPHKGILDFIDNKVDPATGMVKVRARFLNPKGPDGLRLLTPGLFARVRISVTDPYPAILVADRAFLSDQSLKYVLVVNKAKDNLVERVDVTVSNRLQDSGLRQVEAGLKGDEWVIVEGVNRARPGVTVNPKEAKMPHRAEGKNQKSADRSPKSKIESQKSDVKGRK
jgi:RND family efflux transporter MFP subunit